MPGSPRIGLFLLIAALAAAPVRDGGAGASAPPPAVALAFVMPAPGAFIASGPVVVAGRFPATAGAVALLLDGEPAPGLEHDAATFSATFTPIRGQHTLEVRAGDLSARLAFAYGVGRDLPPYRYHAPVLERPCAECHAGARRASPTAEGDTCKTCHRKQGMIFPYVHGPLAAGKCVVCHDPHGSAWPSLTRADARTMCTGCHDQPGSLTHVEQARSRVCYLCHNPHASMNRKFLYDIVK